LEKNLQKHFIIVSLISFIKPKEIIALFIAQGANYKNWILFICAIRHGYISQSSKLYSQWL